MNDNELREFFHSARPRITDEGKFLSELDAKMKAVEQVKCVHDAELRRSRRVTLLAVAASLAFGALVTAVMLLHPVSAADLNASLLSQAADSNASLSGLTPSQASLSHMTLFQTVADFRNTLYAGLALFFDQWKEVLMAAVALSAVIFGVLPLSSRSRYDV